MIKRYRIIPARQWRNTVTGLTASVYGSVPYTSDADKGNWVMETVGWTVADALTCTVGLGKAPFKTQEEADAWLGANQRELPGGLPRSINVPHKDDSRKAAPPRGTPHKDKPAKDASHEDSVFI